MSNSIDAFEAGELLASLVDKSLVVFDEVEGRYRLLETVRQYSRDRLFETGESEASRSKHHDFYLALAEAAKPQLEGHSQLEWMERLETEHDNLRVAMEWSLSREESSSGIGFCGSLFRFWWHRGHIAEGISWCARFFSAPENQVTALERFHAYATAGELTWMVGDIARSQSCCEESLAIAIAIGGKTELAIAHNGMGMVAFANDDYAEAKSHMQEANELAKDVGDRWYTGMSIYFLGILCRIQGDFPTSFTYYQESIQIYREMGDQINMSYPLYDIGLNAYYQCNYADARVYYEESLAIRRECKDSWGVAESLFGLARADYAQGDLISARATFEESIAIATDLSDRNRIALSLIGLALVGIGEGDLTSASAYLVESIKINQELGDRWGLGKSVEGFAELSAKQGLHKKAATLWGAAESFRILIENPMPPVERAMQDVVVAGARDSLGNDSDFDKAWQEGSQLSLEQAIELALAYL